MNNDTPNPLPVEVLTAVGILPTTPTRDSFWSAKRRRPAFLVILVAGLTYFLISMPSETRTSLWAAFRSQRALVTLLFVFALLTLSLIWSAGQRVDAHIFTLFNTRSYPKWLDRLMWLLTQLGNLLTAFAAAAVVFFLNDRHLAFEIILGTLSLLLLVETIKILADRDRPFHIFEDARVIGRQEPGDSFPSGHTSQIFFLMTLFIQHYQLGMPASAALYIVAALVGFTRIYVGAHYPRDVIAGVVLGSVWGILITLINPYLLGLWS